MSEAFELTGGMMSKLVPLLDGQMRAKRCDRHLLALTINQTDA
jgi:hypothetical protein